MSRPLHIGADSSKTHRVGTRPPFECVALVLQGGGSLGAYQADVYEALGEAVGPLRGRDADGTEIAFYGFGP